MRWQQEQTTDRRPHGCVWDASRPRDTCSHRTTPYNQRSARDRDRDQDSIGRCPALRVGGLIALRKLVTEMFYFPILVAVMKLHAFFRTHRTLHRKVKFAACEIKYILEV